MTPDDLPALLAEVRTLAEKANVALVDCRAVDYDEGCAHGMYAGSRWVATFKRKAERDVVLALVNLWPRLLALAEGATGALRLPADRSALIRRAVEADDGECAVLPPPSAPLDRGEDDEDDDGASWQGIAPPPDAQDRAREIAALITEYAQSAVSWAIFQRDVADMIAAALAQRGAGER